MDDYPITTQDILDLLPIVAERGWHFLPWGVIRDSDNRCPLCALVHELSLGEIDNHIAGFTSMRMLLGLPALPGARYNALRPIYDAADGPSHELRPALIEALGGVK